MKKIAVTLMLMFASVAFAQSANPEDPDYPPKDPREQKEQQKDQKEPKPDLSTYHSPFTSDISKSSFGTAKGAFTQGSVTNVSPQRAAAAAGGIAPAPKIDSHHKDTHRSSTSHDPKADAKANAKASYDPGEYKAKTPAKLAQ
jgi:hypothetical protein